MNLTIKYDCEISDYITINEGSTVKVFEQWNEYEGFTAIEYKGKIYYLSDQYFVEVVCHV